jgi:uncharacterized membrane protein
VEILYREEALIDVPSASVFAYRLDFEKNLPGYNPNVSNVRRRDGRTELGADALYEFDVSMPEMGGTLPATLRVLEVDKDKRIVNETASGVFTAREVVTFTPNGGATLVRFEVSVAFPDDMAAVAPLAEQSGREQVRLELEHMKKHLEN